MEGLAAKKSGERLSGTVKCFNDQEFGVPYRAAGAAGEVEVAEECHVTPCVPLSEPSK